MKIKLKDKKKLFKKLILNKEKKENILFIGTIGSGHKEFMFSLFDIMKKENLINKRSIFIDLLDYPYYILKWYSIIQNNYPEKISDNNFCFLVLLKNRNIMTLSKKILKKNQQKINFTTKIYVFTYLI